MKAVIETGGFQYTVSENDKLKIPKVEAKIGSKIKFDKILALINGKKSEFGTPYLKGTFVEGEIIAQERYPKIIVFKFKRRKDYKRTKGHRQHYTEVLVKKISAKKTTAKKTETVKSSKKTSDSTDSKK